MTESALPARQREWLTLGVYIVGAIILIILLAVIGLNLFLSYSKPKIDGEVLVTILENDVTVVRDDMGVPHIEARSDADLYRAQG